MSKLAYVIAFILNFMPFQSWANPNTQANELFVGAMREWEKFNSAPFFDFGARQGHLLEIQNDLLEIIETHSGSELAVKLSIGNVGPIGLEVVSSNLKLVNSQRDFCEIALKDCVVRYALQVAAQIEDAHGRNLAISNIAQTIADLGDPNMALKLANHINIEYELDLVRSSAALGLAEANDLEQALKLSENIGEHWVKQSTLSGIVQTQARKGEIEQASIIAAQIEDERDKSWALQSIARALAETGHPSSAEHFAQSIEHKYTRVQTYADLNFLMSSNKEIASERYIDLAYTTALEINDAYWRALSFTLISRVASKTDNLSLAIQAANEASKALLDQSQPFAKGRAHAHVSTAFFLAGSHENGANLARIAVRAANKERDVFIRNRALASISEIYSNAGLFDTAHEILIDIEVPYIRNFAWVSLAKAQSNSGIPLAALQSAESGLKVALSLEEEFDKVRSLSQIADLFFEIGQNNRAREITQQALIVANVQEDYYSQVLALAGVLSVLR